MCRLLAKIGIETGDIDYYFSKADKPFRSFVKEHGHGWGIGWYENDNPNIYKEGLIEKGDSGNFEFERVKEVESKIIITHLRKTKSADKYTKNAQPYIHKNCIFAHNGSVNKREIYKILETEHRNSITSGDDIASCTDSELYFLMIMQEYERDGDITEAIKNVINKVKEFGGYTGLNFVMSDGRNLYSYREASRKKDYYSLWYLKRGKGDVVICSEKLTSGESWTKIELDTLVKISPDLNIELESSQSIK